MPAPHNAKLYQLIKDAIAAVCVDEAMPEATVEQLYCACWEPGRFNRFWGKGVEFSIAANGSMSMIIDHTYCDGGIETYLAVRIKQALAQQAFTQEGAAAPFRELAFDISGMEAVLANCLERCRELRSLLDQALNAHHLRTKQAQAGLGVNRYLFVLEQICKDFREELGLKETPPLFSNKAYLTMKEDKLSTTSFGHEDMKVCYFPPVIPSGLGIISFSRYGKIRLGEEQEKPEYKTFSWAAVLWPRY